MGTARKKEEKADVGHLMEGRLLTLQHGEEAAGGKGNSGLLWLYSHKTQDLRGSAPLSLKAGIEPRALYMLTICSTTEVLQQGFRILPDLTNEMPIRMAAVEQQVLIQIQNATLEDLHTTPHSLAQ